VVDIYIGIGSNINPYKNVPIALMVLKEAFPSIQYSRVFESEAVGFEGDNFLNLVACFSVDEIDSEKNGASRLPILIKQLKKIENDLGRQKGSKKFSDRNIDIDILLFGDLIINNPIELPRGEILDNAYVLWPLSEIAPEMLAPNSKVTYSEYWTQFDKSLQKLTPIVLS